jgi:predicted esterase
VVDTYVPFSLQCLNTNDQSLLLANDDSPVKTDVAIAFHPSFLVEADLKNINSIPVGIFAGEEDDMMSIDQLNKVRSPLLVHDPADWG